MNRYDAVIFDLDGTLLDTLDDLTAAVNCAMRALGFAEVSREQVRMRVGNGIGKLIERCLPQPCLREDYESALEIFREYYFSNCTNLTVPYDGIYEMLDAVRGAGCMRAVVSNKNAVAVRMLRDKFLPQIALAIGESEGLRRKPAPDMLLRAVDSLGVSCRRTLYVGDSPVDFETARNCKTDCVLVSWGFRDIDLLRPLGAPIIDSPMQLVNMLR